jgi:mono/diheme cytochrome c family protein
MKRLFKGCWLAPLVAVGVIAADEWKLPPEATVLKSGAGREVVLGQCLLCHSADYVTSQPPMARAAWAASVEKMRSKYAAPIPTNSVNVLVDYLTTQYGKPDPAP